MTDVRLYCIELRSADWLRLVAWYRDVVGLRVAVRMTGRQYALLTGSEGRLAILGRDPALLGEPASSGELAGPERRWSLVFETSDLAAVREKLLAAGSPIDEAPAETENYRELVTVDPDGNRVRFFVWPSGSG